MKHLRSFELWGPGMLRSVPHDQSTPKPHVAQPSLSGVHRPVRELPRWLPHGGRGRGVPRFRGRRFDLVLATSLAALEDSAEIEAGGYPCRRKRGAHEEHRREPEPDTRAQESEDTAPPGIAAAIHDDVDDRLGLEPGLAIDAREQHL